MNRREREDVGEHPDILRIDSHRTGEGTRQDAQHIAVCPSCTLVLEELKEGVAYLASQSTPATDVPGAIDEKILAEYRRTIGHRRPVSFLSWRSWQVPAFGAAAAAALVLLLAGPVFRRQTVLTEKGTGSVTTGPAPVLLNLSDGDGDVNGDGAVDILDAFRLARIMESGIDDPGGADLDGDGRLSLIDVDALARRAVAL